MTQEITWRWEQFEAALLRRASTSARDIAAITAEQFRGVIRKVIAITPPGHEGVPGGTRAAQQHGEAKVAGDVAKLYGTPAHAFDAIKNRLGQDDARVFWKLHNSGDRVGAQRMTRDILSTSYAPFDGGALHQARFKNGRVKGKKDRPIFYVSNPKELAAYVKSQQGNVHYLASGWKAIAAKLGITLPQLVTKHDAPSVAVLEIDNGHVRIVATNAVEWASDTDLERRVQFAIDSQTGAMNRAYEAWANKPL